MPCLKKKMIYIVIISLLLVFIYSICSIKVYGKIYSPIGNGNRAVWDVEKLQDTAKDFAPGENGSFLSVSPDPWFAIKESFPIKTVLVDVKQIDETQDAQLFYYSDTQELDEKYSYYFKLDKGINYLQIPDGRFNQFRLDLTDSSGVQLYINNITFYGSRVISSRILILMLSIWGILVKILYHIMFHKKIRGFQLKKTKGFYCLTVGLAFLYSIFLVTGRQLDKNSDLNFTGNTICVIIFLAIVLYLLLYFLTHWLDKRAEIVHVKGQNDPRIFFTCFAAVVLVWLLTYLALFPGVYSTDAPYWYYEFSTEGVPISSQWSPLYCAVFYAFVKLGENLFGTYTAGFAVFSFAQMVFVLYVIWNILAFLNKRVQKYVLIIATAFFILIPSHAILALTSAQDPAFAACFAMCVICLFEMAEAPAEYWKEKKNSVKLCVWLILLCMIRNNGLYAVMTMAFIVMPTMRMYRKQIFKIIIGVLMFILIYQGPVYNVLGIQKGTALREMLSLPLQQMACAYNYKYEKLSQEEIDRMNRYISDEGWRTYEPCIADHVKSQLNTEEVRKNILDFFEVYIDVFLSAPECYMKGAALQTFGMWYPYKEWPDARTWHPYLNYVCADTYGKDLTHFTVSRSSLLPSYEKVLSTLYGKGTDYTGYGGNLSMAFSSVPVFGTLNKAGSYLWLLIYLFFYAIYKRWREPFAVIGIGVGVSLTVFLSPVILYRYCSPIIFTAPLFMAVLFTPWKGNNSDLYLCKI